MAKKPESAPEPIVKVLDSLGLPLQRPISDVIDVKVTVTEDAEDAEAEEIRKSRGDAAIDASPPDKEVTLRFHAAGDTVEVTAPRAQPLSAGRVVMYNAGHPNGVYVAICVFAHNATCGNLVYWTHDGHQHFIERACQGDGKRHWNWPTRV